MVVNKTTAALSRVVERPLASVEEAGPRSAQVTAVGRATHKLELRWLGAAGRVIWSRRCEISVAVAALACW